LGHEQPLSHVRARSGQPQTADINATFASMGWCSVRHYLRTKDRMKR
jgi:hypothetical protein